MRTFAQIEHLLSCLCERCFSETGHDVPLSWAEAAPSRRSHMLVGPHHDWQEVGHDTIWGRPQSYFWFAGQALAPKGSEGQSLWLRIDAQFGRVMGRSDPQCLVSVNGEIVQGADYHHRMVRLTSAAKRDEAFDILIEAGTIEDRRQIGFGCALVTHDAEAEALYFDLATPLDVARHLPENDHRRDVILSHVYEALNVVDLRPGKPERFERSVAEARRVINRIYQIGDSEARPTVTVTGHTHIDVAWLWRERETRQKMARSMATVLTLMKDYPDYAFMYNQGYLLDTLSKDYPELFDAIRARHKEGRFEIEGALWLEPDANMTGGESLIRHIAKGIRYHQETFGVRPRIVWLPDTFGYSAALPQLMKLSGLNVFVTHKMSWNDTNRMPFEIFWWEGLDGTRMPTYFLTTQPMESQSIGTTYGPDLRPSHVMGAWRRFSQKDSEDQIWLVYGHGDGGGGPTREMLERIRRMERGIPGCPKVKHGPMGPFFSDLVARMQAEPERFPAWVGELYLEFHRGTFTSVGEIKRNNRKAEALLREIEALSVLALLQKGEDYPTEEIKALWSILLLNQFHDILPGSSIAEVYEDSRAQFKDFFEQAEGLRLRLASHLGGALIMNPFGQERRGLVQINALEPVALDGVPAQACLLADGSSAQLAPVAMIPGSGALLVEFSKAEAAKGTGGLSVGTDHLENDRLRAEFDSKGRLVCLIDKASGRQVLSGKANHLRAFRDRPAQYDAWDIDETYKDQAWEIDDLIKVGVVENGPYRAAIRFEWRYERSRIVQIISLQAEAASLDIDCHIDWAEPHTLLKAVFPLALRARETVAETQFGHVARPTHRNTSWDQARFELPMHRWVAFSEPGFGVALLNDCKYGYDAVGSRLSLTLLRAPAWPWKCADIDQHRMRYGIAVHGGIEEVPALAEAFNHPFYLTTGKAMATAKTTAAAAGTIRGPVSMDSDALELSALKRSEDGEALIARIWERTGRRQTAYLRFDAAITAVIQMDLLEKPGMPITLDNEHGVNLDLAPFEILTLRMTHHALTPPSSEGEGIAW